MQVYTFLFNDALLIYIQNLGRRKNIEAVLGKNPLWWCWPTVTPGNGLAYKLADTDGKWVELSTARERYERSEIEEWEV